MKKYDDEFKREAVKLAESSACTIKETERNLGLYEGAIREWRRGLMKKDGKTQEKAEGLNEKARIRTLEKENERLRRERDILKKAVAIFSKDPNPYSGS